MISIVIPLYNQVAYTKLCIKSLRNSDIGDAELLLIDNGSSDGTAEYLDTCSDLRLIRNNINLGCAGAWNQGVRNTDSEWVVFLNNDVIVSPGWLEGLLGFAEEEGIDIVSPAIREGEFNYEIKEYGTEFVRIMGSAARHGVADGVCFMVRRRVFETIGNFDEKFRIGQFEDKDFFRRATASGFRLGTTGRSFIHHFGSVTQKSLFKETETKPYEMENRRYFYSKWGLSRWRRIRERRLRKLREFVWRTKERLRFGHTLKEKWVDGRLRYF